MSCRVYVGNLSWGVKWQDLKDHMARAGKVERADVFSDSQGKSKGCGIVEFATADGAKAAIHTLNDSELFGRLIFVREDREETKEYGAGGGGGFRGGRDEYRNGDGYGGRGGFAGRGGGGGGYREDRGGYGGGNQFRSGPPPPRPEDKGRQVFVSNLSWRTSWQDLKDLFKDCGAVIRADVMRFPDGKSKGVGTVLFQEPSAADEAIRRFNDYEFQERRIQVREDKYL